MTHLLSRRTAGTVARTVAAAILADAGSMRVSYGHGSPFVYAIYERGQPVLTFAEAPTATTRNPPPRR